MKQDLSVFNCFFGPHPAANLPIFTLQHANRLREKYLEQLKFAEEDDETCEACLSALPTSEIYNMSPVF